MRNFAIFALAVAVGALGMFAYYQEASLREQRRAIQELTTKLANASPKMSLELQEKCARQARQEFARSGFDKDPMSGFTDHYNDKLNKCFIVIEETSEDKFSPGTFTTSKSISDAFEMKLYGQYMWHSDKVKKFWEVPPFICTVTLPSGEERSCRSSNEFDDLIRVYME